jgi:protein-S-isoprenylcysteine O-methyltransferase Ste14
MREVADWIAGNAIAVVGGLVLLVAAMAIYVVAARQHKHKVQTDSEDPGGE